MNSEIIYSLGREINTSKQSLFNDFIRTHRIDKQQFDKLVKSDYSCLRIRVSDREIFRIEECEEYNCSEISLNRKLSADELINIRPNTISYLTHTDSDTNSYLGGKSKDDFKFPSFEVLNAPFQYIARLNSKELGLTWMPFEHLNICYPLYTGIGEALFFDYTNPLQPELLNQGVHVDHVYGHFSSTMNHVFEKRNLNSTSLLNLNDNQLLSFDYWYEAITGVPFWIQAPNIPRCPKTGKLMRMVAQLTTCDRIKVKESNMVSEKSYFEDDSSNMHFWGGGSMYIFMDPVSKIVGILIQST